MIQNRAWRMAAKLAAVAAVLILLWFVVRAWLRRDWVDVERLDIAHVGTPEYASRIAGLRLSEQEAREASIRFQREVQRHEQAVTLPHRILVGDDYVFS